MALELLGVAAQGRPGVADAEPGVAGGGLADQVVGLGLAVTLEFLGPLGVALAASRRRVNLGCALLAGAAVVALTRPQPTTDYLGIGLALVAAASTPSASSLPTAADRGLSGD